MNQADTYDQTCLIYAVGVADLALIDLLVRHGADVNKCDSNGLYPLHAALMRQNDEICDYLLLNGANFRLNDKYDSTKKKNQSHKTNILSLLKN